MKGALLKKEANIHTFKDLLEYYPFRHIDKTRVDKIANLTPATEYAQVAGRLSRFEIIGEKNRAKVIQRKCTFPLWALYECDLGAEIYEKSHFQ